MSSSKESLLDSLNGAIRENPLGAACIGAGVAWFLLGGSKGLGAAGRAGAAAVGATIKAGGAAATQSLDAVSGVAGRLKTNAADVVRDLPSAGSIVPDIASTEAISEIPSKAGEVLGALTERGRVLHAGLASQIEAQPLLLGAIGLALGAGVASAFNSTPAEKNLLGDVASAARDQIHEIGAEAGERVRTIASEARAEATRQGLTPTRAKEAASDILDKVKVIATDVGNRDRSRT